MHLSPVTGLSHDFLNRFSEVAMALQLSIEAPDLVADLRRWRPVSYIEHFEQSGLAWRAEALDFYERCPVVLRHTFDVLVAKTNRLAKLLIEQVLDSASEYELRAVCEAGAAAMLVMIDALHKFITQGICHTQMANDPAQTAIDALLAAA